MRIMLDTNILISAIYNPASVPYLAYEKSSLPPHTLVLCDQIVDELRRIFNRKFPNKIPLMESFLAIASYDLITLTPEDIAFDDEINVRDTKDRPILRAARKANIDVLVTGDKDFLEADIHNPLIMTAAEFINLSNQNLI